MSGSNENKTFRFELTTLFEKKHALCYRAACSITGSPQEAEDIVQAVFVKLIEKLRSKDVVHDLAGYLYRSVTHEALRVRSRRPEFSEEAVESLEIPAPVEGSRGEEIERMEAALAAITPQHAEILRLRYKEGLSRRQIARKLRRSIGAVAMELLRARNELRRQIRIQEERGETQKRQGDDGAVLAGATQI